MAKGSFGEILKREREMREVTLNEVTVATRIAPRFLEAFEREEWEKLPGGVFNRGFVRAIARYLGLNEENLLSEYDLAYGEQRAGASLGGESHSFAAEVDGRSGGAGHSGGVCRCDCRWRVRLETLCSAPRSKARRNCGSRAAADVQHSGDAKFTRDRISLWVGRFRVAGRSSCPRSAAPRSLGLDLRRHASSRRRRWQGGAGCETARRRDASLVRAEPIRGVRGTPLRGVAGIERASDAAARVGRRLRYNGAQPKGFEAGTQWKLSALKLSNELRRGRATRERKIAVCSSGAHLSAADRAEILAILAVDADEMIAERAKEAILALPIEYFVEALQRQQALEPLFDYAARNLAVKPAVCNALIDNKDCDGDHLAPAAAPLLDLQRANPHGRPGARQRITRAGGRAREYNFALPPSKNICCTNF